MFLLYANLYTKWLIQWLLLSFNLLLSFLRFLFNRPWHSSHKSGQEANIINCFDVTNCKDRMTSWCTKNSSVASVKGWCRVESETGKYFTTSLSPDAVFWHDLRGQKGGPSHMYSVLFCFSCISLSWKVRSKLVILTTSALPLPGHIPSTPHKHCFHLVDSEPTPALTSFSTPSKICLIPRGGGGGEEQTMPLSLETTDLKKTILGKWMLYIIVDSILSLQFEKKNFFFVSGQQKIKTMEISSCKQEKAWMMKSG